tara:strand:+ start:572 stop:901 length:330 start_codon:yes stop_codon:yes gene_type:complete
MELNYYQKQARKTAAYPKVGDNVIYPTLGLCGESGEVAEKVKKVIRDKEGKFDENTRQNLKLELGDVLWYISQLSSELGFTLEEIASENIEKLKSRAERNRISGDGDNR